MSLTNQELNEALESAHETLRGATAHAVRLDERLREQPVIVAWTYTLGTDECEVLTLRYKGHLWEAKRI
jgi:hypothetical protein